MKYILTVAVLSYNRPIQLVRTIKSLLPIPDKVEVCIVDDKSHKLPEIIDSLGNILDSYSQIRFISNEKNLGYDRNLFKSIEEANSDIVLLLGDDDYLEPGAIDNIINFLNNTNNFHCGFLRYKDNLSYNYTRQYERTIFFEGKEMTLNGSFLYNSILFSGLIFRRSSLLSYNSIFLKYFKSIYIQVALFGFINSKYGSFYISGPGIIIGGDGENGFGFNEASLGIDSELKDRSSIVSNLSYHKRLFEVLRNLESDIEIKIFAKFLKEYKIRSVKALFEARRIDKEIGLIYLKELRKLYIPGLFLYEPLYFLILNLPLFILKSLFSLIQPFILNIRIKKKHNKK